MLDKDTKKGDEVEVEPYGEGVVVEVVPEPADLHHKSFAVVAFKNGETRHITLKD